MVHIYNIYSKTYLELVNKLGQYELVPLCAARGREYIRHRPVDRGLLLVLRALQVAVKPDVTRQLEALVLRSERPHVLVRPHGPGACRSRDKRGLYISLQI